MLSIVHRLATTTVLGFALLAQGCAAPSDNDADEPDLENAVGESSDALDGAACPKRATAGDYVLCVTTSSSKAESITVYDRSGHAAYQAEATTSQVDTGAGDDTTCRGGHRILGYQAVTATKHLKNYFGFGCNGQGVHYYPEVGADYDSHGCVRVTWATSEWLRVHVKPALSTGAIWIYVG